MKEKLMTIFAVISLVIGLSLLMYPTVSDYIHTEHHRRAIYDYLQTVESISDEEYKEILEKAEAFNTQLAEHPLSLVFRDEQMREAYYKCLDVTGTGQMGNISIEKANIYLPVYHGASEPVLQIGVGHLEGSSLPVGGTTSHCLLSGHRGLPSALLFTNLDKLGLGDTFTLQILNEVYIYEVDQITTILPHEGNVLKFEDGKDYCTLITCTPYGINTHRLLVRGKRLELSAEEQKMSIQSGARMVNTWLMIGIIELPVLIISGSAAASSERRRHQRKH